MPDSDKPDLEAFRMHMDVVRGMIKCPTCGAHAPEGVGVGKHDCDNPSPQPPAAEQLDD